MLLNFSPIPPVILVFFDLRKKGQLDILVNKAIGCLSELPLEKGDFSEILETEAKNRTHFSEISFMQLPHL